MQIDIWFVNKNMTFLKVEGERKCSSITQALSTCISINFLSKPPTTVFFVDSAGSVRETKAFGFQGKYGCKAET